jgi:hypothetical protein
MCFYSKDQLEEYFNKLSAELTMERILSHEVSKVITGVGENVELIP